MVSSNAVTMFGMDDDQVVACIKAAPSPASYINGQLVQAAADLQGGSHELARLAMNRAKRALFEMRDEEDLWASPVDRADPNSPTIHESVRHHLGDVAPRVSPSKVVASLLSDAQELLAMGGTRVGRGSSADQMLSAASAIMLVAFAPQTPSMPSDKLAGVDWPSTIARYGCVTFSHSRSLGYSDDDCWSVEIERRSRDELFLGTVVQADELDAAVGPVTASELRERLQAGDYVVTLSPGEVLGLRGEIAARLAAAEWVHNPEFRWDEPTLPMDADQLPTAIVVVSGGVVQTVSGDSPMRVLVVDHDNAEGLDSVLVDGVEADVGRYQVADPLEVANGQRLVDEARGDTLMERIVKQADAVGEAYEFGDGVTLAAWGQSSTEYVESEDVATVSRICYLEFDDRRDGEPSERATLHVEIRQGRVIDACCLLAASGNAIGHYPDLREPVATTDLSPGAR